MEPPPKIVPPAGFQPAGHNVRVSLLSHEGHDTSALGLDPAPLSSLDLPHLSPTIAARAVFVVAARENGDPGELVQSVRRSFRDAGVLGVVEHGRVPLQVKLLQAGADAIVELPCEDELLRAKLDALVRRMLKDWSPDGDRVHLSSENKSIRIGKRVVSLRPTEYRLCEYLVTNRGRWVGEREILREVLEAYHNRETSLVRVHVRHLRKALGGNAAYIQSRRGKGYRFETDVASS